MDDAAIYNENALSRIKANGGGVEIHSGEKGIPKSPSWDDWFRYFHKINHQTMVRVMEAHVNRTWIGKGGVTVPTEHPRQFEGGA